MTKKTKPADETPVAEESPAGLASGVALRDSGGLLGPPTPAGALQVAVELLGAEPDVDAEYLLVVLEQKCMNGGSVGLDDIRAVLAKLRG